METYIELYFLIFFLLLFGHWLADYPLQGDYLSKTKSEGPLRVYHLIAHSGIHGGMVLLITGSWILGLTEWIAHTIIDELRIRGKITFAVDQALHIACKWIYVTIIATGVIQWTN